MLLPLGDTALFWAAAEGNLKVASFLVSKGRASVNHKDRTGRTALHAAAFAGHELVVRQVNKSC
jgi:ankyrin repeat protein